MIISARKIGYMRRLEQRVREGWYKRNSRVLDRLRALQAEFANQIKLPWTTPVVRELVSLIQEGSNWLRKMLPQEWGWLKGPLMYDHIIVGETHTQKNKLPIQTQGTLAQLMGLPEEAPSKWKRSRDLALADVTALEMWKARGRKDRGATEEDRTEATLARDYILARSKFDYYRTNWIPTKRFIAAEQLWNKGQNEGLDLRQRQLLLEYLNAKPIHREAYGEPLPGIGRVEFRQDPRSAGNNENGDDFEEFQGERPKATKYEVPFYGEHISFKLDDRQVVDNHRMRLQGLKRRTPRGKEKPDEYAKYRKHMNDVEDAYNKFDEGR